MKTEALHAACQGFVFDPKSHGMPLKKKLCTEVYKSLKKKLCTEVYKSLKRRTCIPIYLCISLPAQESLR